LPKRLAPYGIDALLLVLLLAGRPPAARAGGFTIIEMGSKKTGMMCSIAKPDDLSAVYHNPAGLADLHGTRLHLSSGLSFVDIEARLQAWEGGEGRYGSEDFIDTPVDEDGFFEGTYRPTRYFGAMPMFVAASDFGSEQGPVVALSLYVPDFIGAFLPEDAPTRYLATEAYFVAGMGSLSAGYRLPGVMDWLTIGVSLGLMYVRIEGKRWQNVHLYGDQTADYVLHLIGEDYKFYWNAGLTAEPLDGLTLGLVFLAPVDAALEGSIEFSLPPGVEEEDPVLLALTGDQGLVGRYDQTTHMKIPAGLGVGVNWTVIPELDLAAEYRHWFYRTFDEQVMDHEIDVAIGDAPAVENPMITPKEYRDSWTISAGALVRPLPDSLPLELMAGWTYDESPAPNRTKALDSPTTDLTGISFGARYLLFERWLLSLTYYHYWYLKDTVDNSILDPPQNAQFGGGVDTISLQLEVRI
jgi:long-subunit fatty acid transport protein